MFSEKDLVARSIEDMQQEVDSLLKESDRLKAEQDSMLQKSDDLRRESVDARPNDPELSEMLWAEAERLREGGREMLRLSVENRIRAGDIQHRIDIRAQIESLDRDVYDDLWKKAVNAERKTV
jgi:hypothetical protein